MSKLVSKQCVDFVKKFEGFSAKPYYDEVGVKTLGYGMTGNEIVGLDYVTEAQATSMLEDLLNNKYAAPLKSNLDSMKISLNQNQFDALVSMAYNIGVSGLLGSTLYKNICNGIRDIAKITANFVAWSRAGGNQLPGLLRRRQQEAAMFFGTGNKIEYNNVIMIENVKDPTRNLQIKALVYNLNLDYNAKLIHNDGNIYQELLDALQGISKIIVKGHRSHVVLWVQQKLVGYGYIKKGAYVDMIYDEPTFQAVTNLQKNWSKATSGILDLSTWKIFLNN